jgi:hypothetical protein
VAAWGERFGIKSKVAKFESATVFFATVDSDIARALSDQIAEQPRRSSIIENVRRAIQF